ncbi:MAG: hypothetical protein EA381_11745 [Planctomycetaceae bacterium]|nr:MAG: hypothetical protein EA381_11745 [Planctomycetaceae bacterium]
MSDPSWFRQLVSRESPAKRTRRKEAQRRRKTRRPQLGVQSLEARHLLAALISPGGEDQVGNWTEPLAMTAGDKLLIELAGADTGQFDRVVIDSEAKLGGTLEVRLLDDFAPAVGTTFHVISSVGSSGAFADLTLPTFADGRRLVPVMSPVGMTLVVADPDRPSGNSQLRLPDNAVTTQLTSFLAGVGTTLSLPDVSLTVLGQQVQGSFTFGIGLLDLAPVVTASASNVSVSLGDGLVNLTDGSGSFWLMQNGVAGSASVTIGVNDGLPISFSGDFGLAINTTNGAVNGSVNSVAVDVPAGPYFRVAATDARFTANGQEISGSFVLESYTITENTLPVPIVRGGATGVAALLGSDEGGVRISDGQGGFVIRPTGVAAQFSGNVAMVGVTDELSLSGKVAARINNTGIAVKDTFTTSAGLEVTVDFSDTGTDTVVEFGGALNLSVANFLNVAGEFTIRSQSVVSGSPETLYIGATGVNSFFGDGGPTDNESDDLGLRITGGTLGLVVEPKTEGQPAPYALVASGSAALVGLEDSGLTLSVTDVKIKKNTTGAPFDAVDVATATGSVTVEFGEDEAPEQIRGALDLVAAGFVTASGKFGMERETRTKIDPSTGVATTTSLLKVGVTEVNAFFGYPGESDQSEDDIGLRITDGQLGFVAFKPSMGGFALSTSYAFRIGGTAELVGLQNSGLTLSATDVEIKKNTTGGKIDAIEIKTAGDTITLEFAEDEAPQQVRGSLSLDVSGFVSASGSFGLERLDPVMEGTTTTRTLKLGLSDAEVFLGDPGSTISEDDDMGLRISGGELGLVFQSSSVAGVAQPSTYALFGGGTATLVGIEGLDLSAQVTVRKNTTGKVVTESVKTSAGSVPVVFEEGEENLQSFAGYLNLNAGGFIDLQGGFRVSKTVETSGDETTTKLVLGAGVSGFFGENQGSNDALGVEINDASLGLVMVRVSGATDPAKNGSSYAMTASGGSVSLVGVSGLVLSGSLQARVNKTGKTVDESIAIPGSDSPVVVKFTSDANVQSFGGTLDLAVGDFVTLSGGFSFEKQVEPISETKKQTKLLVGAANVSAFIGVNDGGSPLGFELSGGRLGLDIVKLTDTAPGAESQVAKYALDAGGNVALVGLPLEFSGTLSVRFNNTGVAIDKQISVPNPAGGENITAPIKVAADQELEFSGTDMTLGVADVFSLGGSFVISRESDGKLLVDVQEASLALLVDQQEVVSVSGGAKFTFGGSEGFKLQQFNVGGFNFADNTSGSTSQGSNDGSQGNGSQGSSNPPSGSNSSEEKKLGAFSINDASVSVEGFDLGRLDVSSGTFALSITVGVNIGSASANLGSAISASATNIGGSFGIGLQLAKQAPFVSNVALTGQWALRAESISLGLGQFLTLSATDLEINPLATGDELLVSFGSASAALTAGPVNITGTATSFGVTGDRQFQAGDNFSISLAMTDADPLKLPLPVNISEAKVTWLGDNFNSAPANFQLTLSASIQGNFGPVTVGGSIDSMVIDVSKLRDGQFPIIDMAGFSAEASGNLFGGKISGGVIGGVVKFDTDGNVLPSSATSFADTVFYGGIIAGFEFAGAAGAEIRVGFSELGFLSAYLTSSTPAGILLDPVSGLAIKDFRGGIAFNASPIPKPANPRALAVNPGLKPTTSLTAEQWQNELIQQVVRQKTNQEGNVYDIDAASNNIIRIEAGGTLYSQHVSDSVFKVDVDVIILTNGQFAVVGKGVVGSGAIEADVKLYGDLRSLKQENPESPLELMFLGDLNTAVHAATQSDPLLRIEGQLTLAFLDPAGNLVNPAVTKPDSFELRVLGRGTLAPIGFAKVIIGGAATIAGGDELDPDSTGFAELKLTVVDNPQVKRVALDFSGSISIDGLIKADDLISAAGQLTIEKRAEASLEIWGAAKLDFNTDSPGLSFLKDAGLVADASFLVGLNFSSEDKEVALALPGRPIEVIAIPEDTVLFEAQGTLTFNKNTADILGENDKFNVGAYLEFDGAFSLMVRMNDNDPSTPLDNSFDIELFVAARLSTGLTVGSKDIKILEVDALGLVVVTNLGFEQSGVPRLPTIAARLDLSITYVGQFMEFYLDKAQLLLNTTGQDVIYVVPERLQERIANMQERRGRTREYDANFLSPAPGPDGRLQFTIGGAPTMSNGDVMTAGPYVQLVLTGRLIYAKALELEGSFRITVGAGGFELGIAANASLVLPGAGSFLSAQATGVINVTEAGLYGGVVLAANFNIPGITLTAGVSSYFGINTTSTTRTLTADIPQAFNPVLQPRSAIIFVEGTLSAGGLEINGMFSLEISSESIQMMVNAGIDFFNLGKVSVSGRAGIFYGDRPGIEFDTKLSVNADFGFDGIFDIGGDLRLQINSRAGTQKFEIALENARVKLLHVVEATGSGRIVVQDDYFRIEGNFRGSLLSVITAEFRGFFDSRGNFELFIGAALKLGTDSWGIQAGGEFHILRNLDVDPVIPLDLRASLYGRVNAFGTTLVGANIAVDYSSPPAGDGRIRVEAGIRLGLITIPIRFTLGYLRLDAPPMPQLGSTIDNGAGRTLVLNVGSRSHLRNVDASPDEEDETYIIDSLGPGSQFGERVRVRAFGAVQVFDNVTRIEAIEGGGFGSGNDQLILAEKLGTFRTITVDVDGGDGDDLLINQSSAHTRFRGGNGNDTLLSNRSGDILDGGSGDNELSGVSGTVISAGNGNNFVTWQSEFGAPQSVTLGSGDNRLRVVGRNVAENYVLGGSAGGLSISVTPQGQSAMNLTATGVKTVELFGAGQADTLTVNAAGVAAAGVSSIVADLSRIQESVEGSTEIVLRPDGASNVIHLSGTQGNDTFELTTGEGSDITVNVNGEQLALHVVAPNATRDLLNIYGGDGHDVFTIAPAHVGVTSRTQVRLYGDAGNDRADLPLANVLFDGGVGSNELSFLVAANAGNPLTLTNDRLSAGALSGRYSNVAALTVDGIAAGNAFTVQSTHTGTTKLTSGVNPVTVAGTSGRLEVETTSGAVTINSSGASIFIDTTSGPVTIHGTGGDVDVKNQSSEVMLTATSHSITVTGTDHGDSRVTIGAGLLSKIEAAVAVNKMRRVVYDNSLDGTGRAYTISDSGAAATNHWNRATLSDVKIVELRTGLGDDAVASTIGHVIQIIDAGSGRDQLDVTLHGAPSSVSPYLAQRIVQSSNFETVTFTNTDHTTASQWWLGGGHLDGGFGTTRHPLLGAGTASLLITLGGANDIMDIAGLDAPTSVKLGGGINEVTVGGGNLSGLKAPLTLDAGGSSNVLKLNDMNSPENAAVIRNLTLSYGNIASVGSTITYNPTQFASFTADLGAANDKVRVNNLSIPTATINTRGGNDEVIAGGTLNSLTVNTGDGDDSLILTAGTGIVTFDGGAGDDTYTADRSDATAPLNGSLKVVGGEPVLTLSGLPTVTQTSVEYLGIVLGKGNDTFVVDSAGFEPKGVSLVGGPGDDLIEVRSVGGAADSFTVYGDSLLSPVGDTGRNTLYLIAPNPTANQFTPIVPKVQRLVIDHTQGASAVAWTVKGYTVEANGNNLINAEGAGFVELLGRVPSVHEQNPSLDTLAATGSDGVRPLQITLSGNNANVFEGLNVLGQDQLPVAGQTVNRTVDGLQGARLVTTADNGRLVFTVDGGQFFGRVTVFRSAGPNEPLHFVDSLINYEFPGGVMAGSGNANGLVATPDGRTLFHSNSQHLFIYDIHPITAAMELKQVVLLPITRLQISPDGQTLAVLRNGSINLYNLQNFTAGSTLPEPTTIALSTDNNSQIAFSEDSQRMYVTANKTLTLLKRSGSNYSVERTLTDNAGINFNRYSRLEASADGTLLFAGGIVNPNVFPNEYRLDVFGFGSGVDAPAIRKIAGYTFYNVGRNIAPSQVFPGDIEFTPFKYDSASSTLVINGSHAGGAAPTPILLGYDAASETFSQTAASTFYGGRTYRFQGLDVATVGGKTYGVFAAPHLVDGGTYSTGVGWYDLSSADPSILTGVFTTKAIEAPGGGLFINAAVLAEDEEARFLAVRAVLQDGDVVPTQRHWVRNEYLIYTPAATLESQALASLALDGAYVQSLAAYRNSFGIQSAWWAIENTLGGSDYRLKRYEFASGAITEKQSISLDGPGRISFNADGTVGYVETASGRHRYAVEADGTIGELLGTDATKGGYAVAGDYQYTAPLNVDGIDRLPVDASDNSALKSFRDGYGALALSSLSGVVASADGATIYVRDGNQLTSIRQIEGVDTVVHSMTMTQPTGDKWVRAGDRLYSAWLGYVTEIVLDSTSGLPSSLKQLRDLQSLEDNDVAVGMNSLLMTSFGGSRVSLYDISNGLIANSNNLNVSASQSLTQGQADVRSLSGVSVSATSPDGRFLYGYSPTDKALGVYDRETNAWTTFFDGVQVPIGALTGVPSIAISSITYDVVVNGIAQQLTYHDALVVNPNTGAYTVFRTSGLSISHWSWTTPAAHGTQSYLVGARSLTHADGKLYVATTNDVKSYDLPAPMGVLPAAASATLSVSNATKLQVAGGRAYVITGGGTGVTSVAASLMETTLSATGLTGLADVAVFGSSVYAVSATGRVFHFEESGSALTLINSYANGNGITGLRGASAVSVAADGSYVFVAGTADSSIVVFLRDTNTGALTFVQSARDGRAASGIFQPSAVFALSNNKLVVASASARNNENSGFAVLSVAPLTSARPFNVQTTFTDMTKVTLEGGSDNDTIRLLSAPALVAGATVELTILGHGGDDLISVSDMGPTATKLTIDAGTGNDVVTIQQTVSRPFESGATPRAVTIIGGSGSDQVVVQNVATNANVAVNVNQAGTDIDIVRVRGEGIPVSSSVTVSGDLATGTGPSFAGDALFYDGEGAGFLGTHTSNDTIVKSGFGNVVFTGLYKADPKQVFLTTAPRPSISISSPTISEGQSVTFTATDLSNQPGVRYEWDLDGDGDFGDARGASITLTWDDLVAFGINDGARSPAAPTAYPIAVRATTTENAQSFGGQIIELAADASTMLLVTDTAPTLADVPGLATLGVAFTIPLKATDPGNDRVQKWAVNWGDGTSTATLGADATSATHVYAKAGDFKITVTVLDEDGETSKQSDVQVRPGTGSVVIASYSASIAEGDGFTATAGFEGTPIKFQWDFGADGTYEVETTTPTITQTWDDLKARGVRDNGTFSIRVRALYNNESIPTQTNPATFTATSAAVSFSVVNTAPTGTLALSSASVIEGSSAGSITVMLTNYADPSPEDTAATASLDLYFDVSLTADIASPTPNLANQAVGTAIDIPASVFSAPGLKTVRAVLRDKDGGARELFATFFVAPVAPTLSANLSASTINEGSVANLTLTANHPVGVAIHSWRIQWGDGSVQTADGNGTATQTFTHTYVNGAIGGTDYDILVTAITARGDVSTTSTITVNDVAPTVTLSAPSLATVQGAAEPFTVQLAVTDPGDDTADSLVIDWGDGTIVTLPGNVTTASHTYLFVPTDGTFMVKVTQLTDNEGTFFNPSNTLSLTVANASPVFPNALTNNPSISVDGQEGTPILLSASAASMVVGYEPLTFSWTVSRNGSTVYQHDFTPSPVAILNLAATPDEEASDVIWLSAFGTDVLGADVTTTWMITSPDDETVTLSGDEIALNPDSDGTYSITITTNSVNGTATATAALIVSDSQVRLGSISGVGTHVVRADGAIGYEFLSSSSDSFTPADNGLYLVTLSVTDPQGATSTYSRTIDVANVAPTIASFDGPETGTSGEAVTFTATATDPAGIFDPLTFTWTVRDRETGQTVASQSGSGTSFAFTPYGGLFDVILVVSDKDGGEDQRVAVLEVENTPPAIGSQSDDFIVPATAFEGQTSSFSANASSVGGEEGLSYQWTVRRKGPVITLVNNQPVHAWSVIATLPGRQVQFTWPDNDQYLVTLTVTDRFGDSDSRVADVLVSNLPPVITSVSVPTSGVEGVQMVLSAAAVDPGLNDSLNYRWTITSPGQPDANDNVIVRAGANATFTPPDNGVYSVQLTVFDNDGGSTTQAAGTISVANADPVLGSIVVPSETPLEGQTVRLSVPPASDVAADVPSLQYAWTITQPDGNLLHFAGRVVDIPLTDSGNYLATVVVIDKDGGQAARMASFDVGNVAPTITSFNIPQRGYVGFGVPFSAAATDVPGDIATLQFTWTITDSNNQSVTVTGSNANYAPTVAGVHQVVLEVADKDGGKTTRSGAFAVFASTVSIQTFGVPSAGTKGTALLLNGSATDALGAPVILTWTIAPPAGKGEPTTRTGSSASFVPTRAGIYQITLSASSVNGSATISTEMLIADVAPTVTSVILPELVMVGVPASLSATASYPTTEPLNYTWTIFPPIGAPIVLSGDQVTFTPRFSGNHTIRLTVSGLDGAQTAINRFVSVVAPIPFITEVGETRLEGTPVPVKGVIGSPANPVTSDAVSLTWNVFKGTNLYASGSGGDWSFVPNDNGQYRIVLTASVPGTVSNSTERTITVANVAPTPTLVSISSVRLEGTTIQVSGTATDPGFAVPNDGVTLAWSVFKNSGPTAFATGTSSNWSFTPDDNGSYRIVLTATDKDSASTSVEQTITVANIAPTPSIVSISSVRLEGTAIQVSGTATDPGFAVPNDGVTLAWSVFKNGGQTAFATGAGSDWSFTPNDNGSYRIVLTATDKDGASTSVEQTITVANVAPTPSIVSISSVRFEGTAIQVSGTATDPGFAVPNDGVTLAWTVFKNGGQTAFATGTGSDWSFTPDDNDSYRIVLTATDKDSASTSVEQTITVANVAPTPSIVSISSVRLEGTAIHVSGTATDPGFAVPNDGVTLAWSVFKNGGQTAFATGTSSNWSFTPNDNGSYRIVLTATDKDGASTSVDETIAVTNVAPIVAISPPVDGFDGVRFQERTFELTAIDASPLDQAAGFEFVINWGDGSQPVRVSGLSGTRVSHTFVDSGQFEIRVTATDKDLGTSSVYVLNHTIRIADLQGTTLLVSGSEAADEIVLSGVGTNGVQVSVNGVTSGPFLGVETVRVNAYGGDDSIEVQSSVTPAVVLDGGTGDDNFVVGFHGNGSTRTVTIVDDDSDNRLTIHGANSTSLYTITPDTTTRGLERIDYSGAGLAALEVLGGRGLVNAFLLNETRPATETTIDGGQGFANSLVATFANALAGRLNLRGLENSHILIGRHLTGTLDVKGTLSSLYAGGATPGTITADHVGTVRAQAGTGPLIMQIAEGGVQRRVELGTPENPYPLTASDTASPAGVTMRYLYEGTATGLTHPQLTARMTNSGFAPFQYDVSLVTYDAQAKFNLARLDANGASGVRNVAIEGDLLTSVTTTAANWFGSGTTGGVRLPQDDLAGVAVRDLAPHYAIAARSIQAVAFGSHRKDDGKIELGIDTSRGEARKLLASGTALTPARNTFRVPFSDQQHMALFFVESAGGGGFTDKPIYLTVQYVVAAADPLNIAAGNVITKSNAERGAATALVTVIPSFDDKGKQKDSQVLAIDIRGDGASIDTRQSLSAFVTNETLVQQFEAAMSDAVPHQTKKTKVDGLFQATPRLTSTGPMGDLTLHGPMDADVWVTSLFGSLIINSGPLTGVVQTTGLRTDPITGEVTLQAGDVGQLYVAYDRRGKATFETTRIQVGRGGGLSGQLLVRGDLVSHVTVNGGMSGLIATEGSIGVETVEGPVAKRLGGITVNGGLSGGQIIVLDSIHGGHVRKKSKVVGDVVINGGMRDSQIAVQGDLASLKVNGTIDGDSAVVVGGRIGTFDAGTVRGIVAAKGGADSVKVGNTKHAQFYDLNVQGSNAEAVDHIFLHDQFDGGVDSFDDFSGIGSEPMEKDHFNLALLEVVKERLNGLHAADGTLRF